MQKSAKKNVGRGRSRQSPRGDRADEQRFNGDLMGFNGDLMGFNGDLMGFNGDLMDLMMI